MRKLLQSKLAVTVLALVAIVMIGRPILAAPGHGDGASGGRSG